MTTIIKSSKEEANKQASDITNAVEQGLGVEDNSMLATKTTVNGNIKAMDSLKRTSACVERLSKSLKKDSKKIMFIAKSFDDLDTEYKYRLKKNF